MLVDWFTKKIMNNIIRGVSSYSKKYNTYYILKKGDPTTYISKACNI